MDVCRKGGQSRATDTLGRMLMSPETARFVSEHRRDNVRDLALHAKRADGLDLPFALDQIAGWQTARGKLPEWAAYEGIVYPPHISMEQCSSEFTARYKAEVARRIAGESEPQGLPSARGSVGDSRLRGEEGRPVAPLSQSATDSSPRRGEPGRPAASATHLIDLTGGFGVDFSYMAREFAQATYVERQEHLCELAEHNMRALGLHNVTVVNGDAETILRDETATLIFVDPARRDEHGGRTIAIEDCTPDVLALRDRLLAAAPHVMIKLSPMLDWRKAVADFHGAVSEVHIVSTGNECKELLLVLGRQVSTIIRVHCVNDADRLDYDYDPTNAATIAAAGRSLGLAPLPEPITYLYEPNASIMKAGCFALVEERYGLTQIGPNSHLFVTGVSRPIADFPGRRFAVDAITTMGKKELKTTLAGLTKANVAVRNFPLTVAQLRKKLRLSDGGDTYLFATTLAGSKHVILRCSRLPAGD